MINEFGEGYTTMPRKGYGKIFVEKIEDIEKVKQIIREIDAFEYDYLPDDLITNFKGEKEASYTGKFDDLDINDLIVRCWNEGIKCFYII